MCKLEEQRGKNDISKKNRAYESGRAIAETGDE